ncbi:protein kinase [Streptomyces pilosus]|uniref:serine/threonine-protein kinase n=1 Tax=Streptomyces pilosus TaxID=28893 RepID=UPI00167B85A1|nr:serine/threonine-protein kinase [Streptomyces pilosus]GGV46730.1 serine/threonine protein kinase [Streptomyces pilosus]
MRLRESAVALATRCYADVLAGRYRLDAVIGSGGAADVHRGLDLRLRRPVAVKMFRPGADGDMEARFRGEALILARLQHPGLVTVYDAGQHNNRAYLVMQLIEGPTLRARIAEGPLSPAETAALGAGLANALAHAHEADVIHRDVKPSNIILDPSGQPHLTDFGISQLIGATTHTATGTLIGTAAYLSPEQVLGQPVSQAVDIYALGLVLLECLTGRLEYGGGPLEAAIARLHRRPELPDSLPEDFADLLRNMTALDDGKRPSAHECARALAALAGAARPMSVPSAARILNAAPRPRPARDAEPTHRNPLPAAGPARPGTTASRRHALVAGGAAALAAVLTTALAVSDSSSHQAPGAKAPQAAGRHSAPADPPQTAAESRNTTPVAPSSSLPGAPSEAPRDAASERDPGSAAAQPSRKPATDAAARGTAVPTSHPGSRGTPGGPSKDSADLRNETGPRAFHAPPGKPATPGENRNRGRR